jgi:hypothetical protein
MSGGLEVPSAPFLTGRECPSPQTPEERDSYKDSEEQQRDES